MRRALAALVLVLVLAPEASAQPTLGQPVRIVPTQAEITAQTTMDASYLLATYMAQLAAAGTPPTQDDIEAAARQYFTNGAALVALPASGPGAAYFHNGAAVMAYPATPAAPPPATTSAPEESMETETVAEATEPVSTAPAPVQAAPEVQTGTSTAPVLACGPLELEAAMAIASQFATAEAPPPPPAVSCEPCPAPNPYPVQRRAESQPVAAVETAPPPACPAGPSLLSRLAPALGGALFGGLAVVLWSRPWPRPIRVTRVRKAH